MRKPLCKLCATRHYSHEPHNFSGSDEAPDAEVGVVEKRRVDDSPKPSRKVIPEKVKRVALTVAERSARYRAKLGNVYRARNKLRMGRKRGG